MKGAKYVAGLMAMIAMLSLTNIPLAQARGGGSGWSGGGWHGGYGGWHGGYGGWRGGYGGWHGGYGGWHGRWGFYWGGPIFGWGWPYYAPPTYYYPPPPVYYPPVAPAPGDGYSGYGQTTTAPSSPGVAQLCVASPYTCPMEVTVSPGARCYCRGNQGQRVYGAAQ